jgi:hypothetical protein
MKDGTATIQYTKEAHESDPVLYNDQSGLKPGSTELLPQASVWINCKVQVRPERMARPAAKGASEWEKTERAASRSQKWNAEKAGIAVLSVELADKDNVGAAGLSKTANKL